MNREQGIPLLNHYLGWPRLRSLWFAQNIPSLSVDLFHENLEMGETLFHEASLGAHCKVICLGSLKGDISQTLVLGRSLWSFQGPHVENQHFVSSKNGQKTGFDSGGQFLGALYTMLEWW